PTSFSLGAGYRPFDRFFIALETQKILDRDLSLKGGLEYEAYENLFLRTGISTAPLESTFGLGVLIKKISVDVAFTHTKILGFTPHFSIQIRFN
ncbi:MAG TPA: hypothetical protein VE912_09765, partial [Bacteroidales bacterium]|nr:hypothetical protein [Bacteroidales bacterium]